MKAADGVSRAGKSRQSIEKYDYCKQIVKQRMEEGKQLLSPFDLLSKKVFLSISWTRAFATYMPLAPTFALLRLLMSLTPF